MTSTAPVQEMALRRMLDARRVAIVGASDREGSAGFRVASYLKHSGFTGTVIYVNPSARTILGENPVASLRECAGVPIDHAMLLIPAREVPSAVRDAASVGVASLSIFAAGYAERDAGGRARQDELVGVARDAGMRLLGPNCLGYINMHTGLTMTTTSLLEEVSLPEGNVTIITQSGGAGMHIAALLARRAVGIRYYVSTGNEADVQLGEMLRVAVSDEATEVVFLYLEGVRDRENFVRGLREAADAGKRIVALKVGNRPEIASVVRRHTDAPDGSPEGYLETFSRLGVYPAASIPDAVNATAGAVDSRAGANAVSRLAVLTISGGLGAITAEHLLDAGYELPQPPSDIQEALVELLPFCTPANPIDTTAQLTAQPEKLLPFLRHAERIGQIEAIVLVLGYTTLTPRVFDGFYAALREAERTSIRRVVIAPLTPPQATMLDELGILAFADVTQLISYWQAARSFQTRRSLPYASERDIAALAAAMTSAEESPA